MDFFSSSITSSFSASFLRSARTSASNSRSRRGVPVLPVCLTHLYSSGFQPTAQRVNADTKLLGHLFAGPSLLCHHPHSPCPERLHHSAAALLSFCCFCRLFSSSLSPFLSIISRFFLSINSGRGAQPGKGERKEAGANRPVFHLCGANPHSFEDWKGVLKRIGTGVT